MKVLTIVAYKGKSSDIQYSILCEWLNIAFCIAKCSKAIGFSYKFCPCEHLNAIKSAVKVFTSPKEGDSLRKISSAEKYGLEENMMGMNIAVLFHMYKEYKVNLA